MAAREKPLEKEMAIFVKAHMGKGIFAPFTGTDYAAWKAWCHLLRLWGSTHDPMAIEALRATLRCAQKKCCIWEVFVQTIPGALDWGYVKTLWPQIVDAIAPWDWPRDLDQSWNLKSDDGDLMVHRKAALMSFFAVDKPDEPGLPVRRYGMGWS